VPGANAPPSAHWKQRRSGTGNLEELPVSRKSLCTKLTACQPGCERGRHSRALSSTMRQLAAGIWPSSPGLLYREPRASLRHRQQVSAAGAPFFPRRRYKLDFPLCSRDRPRRAKIMAEIRDAFGMRSLRKPSTTKPSTRSRVGRRHPDRRAHMQNFSLLKHAGRTRNRSFQARA